MLTQTINLAKDNPSHKYKLAAIITTKRGKLISTGFNSYSTTHPLQYHYGKRYTSEEACYIHAELSAVVRAKGKGDYLYVARVDKQGAPRNSRPCKACMAAIKNETNIKKVVYTINNNEHGVIEVKR